MMLFNKVRHSSCLSQHDAKDGTKAKNASNGGYILVYVMVVVLTLCILAASICTSAVRNLKVQQHSINHMKFVYEAEGIGERFVAELQRAARFEDDGVTDKIYTVMKNDKDPDDESYYRKAAIDIIANGYKNGLESVESAIVTARENALADSLLERDKISIGTIVIDTEGIPYYEMKAEVPFSIVSGDSRLDAVIETTMTVKIKVKATDENGDPIQCDYSIGEISFEYLSYVIGAEDPIAEQGGGDE